MNEQPPESNPAGNNEAVKRFFAFILISIGFLFMGTAGVCSLIILFNSGPANLVLIAIFGGVPILVGFLLFKWGKYLKK